MVALRLFFSEKLNTTKRKDKNLGKPNCYRVSRSLR